MIEFIPPAFIYIIGALLIPLLRGKVKSAYMLALPRRIWSHCNARR